MTTTAVALMISTFGAGKPTGSKYTEMIAKLLQHSYIPASRVLTITCSAVTLPAPFIASKSTT